MFTPICFICGAGRRAPGFCRLAPTGGLVLCRLPLQWGMEQRP